MASQFGDSKKGQTKSKGCIWTSSNSIKIFPDDNLPKPWIELLVDFNYWTSMDAFSSDNSTKMHKSYQENTHIISN